MIEKKTVTLTIRELFFYLFFAIMFGMRMWGIYEGKPLYGILLVIGFVLWGISMLMNEHTLLEYTVIACLMVVAVLVYINTGEKGLLLYFALMLGMKGIDAKRLFKVGIAVGGLGMATLTFLASFGIIEDVAYVQERAVLGSVFRRSLGFPHPNTLSTSFTILTMMTMYCIGKKDKRKVWKATIILSICAAYIYLYTGSRTGIAITAGYLMLNLFYVYRNRLVIIEKVIVATVIPVIWGISVIVPQVLSQEALLEFVRKDPTLAARWTVANYYLTYNSVTPFGRRLINPEAEVDNIDMSQFYLYIQLGIIAFVIVTILWIAILYDEMKNKKLSELVITVPLLAMGITDPFLYNQSFKNVAFAFMGVWLFGYLARIGFKLPDVLKKTIRLIPAGEKNLLIPDLAVSRQSSHRKTTIVMCLGVAVLVAASLVVYAKTPNPSLVLADRGMHEKSFEWGKGRTYIAEEIKAFEADGNLVMNYTDESETMYLFYTDMDNAVEGGIYAPMLGIMEKLRKSVSIVFWGICLWIAVSYLGRMMSDDK